MTLPPMRRSRLSYFIVLFVHVTKNSLGQNTSLNWINQWMVYFKLYRLIKRKTWVKTRAYWDNEDLSKGHPQRRLVGTTSTRAPKGVSRTNTLLSHTLALNYVRFHRCLDAYSRPCSFLINYKIVVYLHNTYIVYWLSRHGQIFCISSDAWSYGPFLSHLLHLVHYGFSV